MAIDMNVKIRTARLDDLDTLTDLVGQLFSIESDFIANEKRQRQGLQLMLSTCQKHSCIKVAEVVGRVVAMCTVQTLISTAEGGRVGLVEDMIVDPHYRGNGIGRMVMEHIEGWAVERGLSRLQLVADRDNFPALDFYDSIGWRPTRMICLRRKWSEE